MEQDRTEKDRTEFSRSRMMLLLIGGIFLFFGISNLARLWGPLQDYSRSVTVPAVIVDAVSDTDEDSTMYTPVFRYVYKGKEYTATPNYSSKEYPKVGSEQTIHIHANHPEKMVELWAILFHGFAGGVCVFFGVLFLSISGGRKKRRP